MSGRDRILGAIRARLGTRAETTDEIAAQAAALIATRRTVQPDFAGVATVDRFIAKATSERVTATVARTGTLAEVPAVATTYLRELGQAMRIAVQPTDRLRALDWAGFTLTDRLEQDGGGAVTFAEYGVAETGSVAFRSGADAPLLLNFLPLVHIVVVEADSIVDHLEDLWPRLSGPDIPAARALTLITGTSGTADIEAKNVRGAHGPRHMHIVIVGG